MEKFEMKTETIEAFARVTDLLMMDEAIEKELFDSYVNSLNKVAEFIEKGDYETAMNMLAQTALLLDDDAEMLMEVILCFDYTAMNLFLDYYCDYIIDGYLNDRIFEEAERLECGDEEMEDEELADDETIDDLSKVLDDAYAVFKKCIDSEVNENDRCKGCCCM